MADTADTLYIIDGHSQIYRAYYAPFRDLNSPTGEPTRATYVFSTMLLKLIREKKPRYLAMAVDGPTEKLHRKKIYSDYKVTRNPMPEDLPVQIRRIMQIVEALNVPVLKAEGFEADDVLASICEKYSHDSMKVVIVSRDKDLEQLIGPNVVMYDPMKEEVIDAAAVEAAKGYPPGKAAEVQVLCGDAIDNVPGVTGVGPKTAAKLINKYGSAEQVIAHADELTPKLRQNVLDFAPRLELSRKLIELERHVPVNLDLPNLEFHLRGEGIRPIFKELGFTRLLEQMDNEGISGGRGGSGNVGEATLFGGGKAAATTAPSPADVQAEAEKWTSASDAGFSYSCVDTSEKLDKLVAELAGVTRLAIDVNATSRLPMTCDIAGISLAWKPCHGVYLPVRGPLGAAVLDVAEIRGKLGPILASESVEKIGHDLKRRIISLKRCDIELGGKMFDTMIASYVLDSNRLSYKIDALAAEFLRHRCIVREDIIGRGKNQTEMDKAPIEQISCFAAETADVALRLSAVLKQHLADEKLLELFEKLEMPLMPVLAEMEMVGILLDGEALRQMRVDFSKQCDVLRGRIIASAGYDFNPDSPRQLGEVLFNTLQLPSLKKTKTGHSTDSEVLEELAASHELPALVLEYRKLNKLLGTYLVAMGESVNPRTQRIHTSFNQAGTTTGRLSSSDPNLQNIPIRSEEGRQIRRAFVADEGCMLLAADYSQIELRVLAHFCQDPTLIAAFKSDQDIHRIVAAEVFGVALSQVTPEMRGRAKTVNFGIIYGQTAFGLARTLRIPRGEAGEFIKQYRLRFPQIDAFLQQCIAKAKADGYVETIFGRRRKIADIDSRNPGKRSLAERLAINSVVQGSAADLIKQAMVNVAGRLKRQQRPARMLLQIHDELIFETPQDAVEVDKQIVREEMSNAIKLAVPLKVDVGAGKSWMDAK